MVAQKSARKPRTPKPATIVHIRVIDPLRGTYSALSSAGDTLYVVDVAHRVCTCPATQSKCHAGSCKHIMAARVWARGLASMSKQARTHAPQSGWVKLDRVVIESLDAPLGTPTQAVELPVPVDIMSYRTHGEYGYQTA